MFQIMTLRDTEYKNVKGTTLPTPRFHKGARFRV